MPGQREFEKGLLGEPGDRLIEHPVAEVVGPEPGRADQVLKLAR
jgi:hypothetical protein